MEELITPHRCSLSEPKRQRTQSSNTKVKEYTLNDVVDDGRDPTINHCSVQKHATDTNANNIIQSQNQH